jgi:hypothetical protein
MPLQVSFASLLRLFSTCCVHQFLTWYQSEKKLKVQSEGSTSSEELIGQIWWTFYTKHFYYVMTADEVWITDHSIAVLMLYVMCLVEGAKGTCLVSSLL